MSDTKPGYLGVQVPAEAEKLGELANNPLNIMESPDNWQAKAGIFRDAAGGYVVFREKDGIPGWVWGYRAAFVDWNSKLRAQKDGVLTLRELIEAWAPAKAHNNNTEAYIANVVGWSGIPEKGAINPNDRDQCVTLARAMTRQEEGRCIYSDEDIGWGWDLAHGIVKPRPVKSSLATVGKIATGAATASAAKVAADDHTRDAIVSTAQDVLPNAFSAAMTPGVIGWVLVAVALIPLGYLLWKFALKPKQEV